MLSDQRGQPHIPLDPGTLALFSSRVPLASAEDSAVGRLIPEFGTGFVRQMLAETKPATFDGLYLGLSHGTGVCWEPRI